MKMFPLVLMLSFQLYAIENYAVKQRVCLEGNNEAWAVYDPSEDRTITVHGLKLEEQIRVIDSGMGMENAGDSLQYITRSKAEFGFLRKGVGKRMKVCGKLVLQITSHHHTSLLIDVDTALVLKSTTP